MRPKILTLKQSIIILAVLSCAGAAAQGRGFSVKDLKKTVDDGRAKAQEVGKTIDDAGHKFDTTQNKLKGDLQESATTLDNAAAGIKDLKPDVPLPPELEHLKKEADDAVGTLERVRRDAQDMAIGLAQSLPGRLTQIVHLPRQIASELEEWLRQLTDPLIGKWLPATLVSGVAVLVLGTVLIVAIFWIIKVVLSFLGGAGRSGVVLLAGGCASLLTGIYPIVGAIALGVGILISVKQMIHARRTSAA